MTSHVSPHNLIGSLARKRRQREQSDRACRFRVVLLLPMGIAGRRDDLVGTTIHKGCID